MAAEVAGKAIREALEPCPFCGAAEPKLHTNLAAAMSWVSCASCGLEAPTETGVTDNQAVAYWNRRDRTGAGGKAAWKALGEAMSQGDYSRSAFERIEAALRPCLSPVAVEEADTKADPAHLVAIKALTDAGNRLSVCAQTTGGTAGSDEELREAISGWSDALDKARAMKRIAFFEPPSTPSPQIGKAGAAPVGEAVAGAEDERFREAWSDFEDGHDLVREGHRHIRYHQCCGAFEAAWPDAAKAVANAVAVLYARPAEEPGEVEALALGRAFDEGYRHGAVEKAAPIPADVVAAAIEHTPKTVELDWPQYEAVRLAIARAIMQDRADRASQEERIRENEREACARVVDDFGVTWGASYRSMTDEIAKAVRARLRGDAS